MNEAFPASRDDFQSEEAYKEWRSQELASLQQEMLEILQRSPELVKTSSSDGVDNSSSSANSSTAAAKRTSMVVTEAGEAYVGRRISSNNASTRSSLPIAEQFASTLSFGNDDSGLSDTSASNAYSSAIPWPPHSATSTSTSRQADDTAQTSSSTHPYHLAFSPPTSPRSCYIRLLTLMLSYDLEAMSTLDPSEEVPLRILSKPNQNILHECARKWRIFDSAKFVSFLDEMTLRYARGEMPVVECVTEALGDWDDLVDRMPVDHWPTIDVSLPNCVCPIEARISRLFEFFTARSSVQYDLDSSGCAFERLLRDLLRTIAISSSLIDLQRNNPAIRSTRLRRSRPA